MRKLIRVKQEHIDAAGNVYSVQSCPIARAIKDVFPDLDVYVQHYTIWLGHNFMRIEQPESVHAFVRKYDTPSKRKSVKPFNFYLEVPNNA